MRSRKGGGGLEFFTENQQLKKTIQEICKLFLGR